MYNLNMGKEILVDSNFTNKCLGTRKGSTHVIN